MRFRIKKFTADFNEKELSHIIDVNSNPEQATDLKLIHEQILALPDKTSEAMILFHIADLSLEEIHKIQGGSLSGVKQRLKRGRERLIQMLNTPEQVKIAFLFLYF